MNINKVFDGITNFLNLKYDDNQTQTKSQPQSFVPQTAVDGWLGNLYKNFDNADSRISTQLANSPESSQPLPQIEVKPQNEINGLAAGESIPIKINSNDTQEDVLRKAYSAYADKAGLSAESKQQFVKQMMNSGGTHILHAGTDIAFTDTEFAAKKAQGSIEMIPTESQIAELRLLKVGDLFSYGVFDWSVSATDEGQIIDLLKNDPNISATIKNLSQENQLEALITRVDEPATRRELIQILAAEADDEASKLIESQISNLDLATVGNGDANLWQVQYRLTQMGIKPTEQIFDKTSYNDLISSNPSAGFSGVGATGKNPIETSVPWLDQLGLLTGSENTTAKYSNPIPGSLSDYLDTIDTENRHRQAELFLRQPVSSSMPEIFGGQMPSRADVIRAAAEKYNLDPRMVAGIILAEQRDQSQLEDAKDYTAATSIKQANTSIGLGQVVISTAQNNDLFSDLIDVQTKNRLSHDDYARLLADDMVNIFATAKYIRLVADKAATAPPEVKARFESSFPGIDFSKFKENSSNWSEANIQALGSEYTTSAWDVPKPDKNPPFVDSPGWGYFVGEAYKDVDSSGVFK